ncbi:MAG: diaminopimelate epimerase [Dokdonella sp.]|uniref:diaminopimelate epimerase n=1 Tax=Dokdonella sp. TaxID=2291710 RepID=UPI0025B91649|nr:diaminopimelate epimerase [Dokdonella sp.]MBX3700142.1 diaminopimelate epimerase [Dokdonella sp.]MCW5579529.1 diaminopimelate epimerase [Dokdonella sp.]
MGLRFAKMHGIGNDFVVLDCRAAPLTLTAAQIRSLADRHRGVGFDQLLTIERSPQPDCAFAYGVWNADGSRSGQCGNGLRCVARWLAREGVLGVGVTRLMSPSGVVEVELGDDGRVAAAMGVPRFAPADIPLLAASTADSYRLDLAGEAIDIGAVSMGNPHALVEVADIAAAPVATLGPRIEHCAQFPQRCNVGFVQVLGRDAVALRVWERAVGETLACGSAACAAVAILRRRGRLDASVRVRLPGGELQIDWPGGEAALRMSGPAAFVFDGELDPDMLVGS